MLRTFTVAVALFALLVSTAEAQTTLYSKTLYGGGTCNGQDIVAVMQTPWESVSINIVGVELTVFQGTIEYAFAGNSFSPDLMSLLGEGEVHGETFYPAGAAFPFPASSVTPAPHIDLHVFCASGPFQMYETVYYTKNAQ